MRGQRPLGWEESFLPQGLCPGCAHSLAILPLTAGTLAPPRFSRAVFPTALTRSPSLHTLVLLLLRFLSLLSSLLFPFAGQRPCLFHHLLHHHHVPEQGWDSVTAQPKSRASSGVETAPPCPGGGDRTSVPRPPPSLEGAHQFCEGLLEGPHLCRGRQPGLWCTPAASVV